ncbi:hypothetical protein [Leisingera sp. McT4-56]|uniref:hypothetical protein n=1 Tax=Leisingera sp. McT4-56 TaxID=2881255 RepID=UPI001CF88CAC|nr:hypothetical protein [Leisingera sp. McT4-56]MCB4456535.1 hypothetical protein [Leisingera sp. McT4-56]
MTLEEAIATQPQWVQIWVNILFLGAFVLPLALLIWKPSRIAGLVTVAASLLAGGGVYWIYGQLGYVRLLGLPHVILWTPLAVWLWRQRARPDMPAWPRRIILMVCAVIAVSLAFDYVDLARYLLGERQPF